MYFHLYFSGFIANNQPFKEVYNWYSERSNVDFGETSQLQLYCDFEISTFTTFGKLFNFPELYFFVF